MSILYDRISELCKVRNITGYRLCKDIGIQPSIITDLKMGRKEGLSAKNADKIAVYFSVPVSYLLGTENKISDQKEKASTEAEAKEKPSPLIRRELSDDAMRIAMKASCLSEDSRRVLEDYIDYLASKGHQ